MKTAVAVAVAGSMTDDRERIATLCVWPTAGALNVLVDGQHYSQAMAGKQMLWLAERFIKAATEQGIEDLERRERAARQT